MDREILTEEVLAEMRPGEPPMRYMAAGGNQDGSGPGAIHVSSGQRQTGAAAAGEGHCLPRSSLTGTDRAVVWTYHLQLVEVKRARRNLKGDLAVRSIFHQDQTRIKAHIFVSFMAHHPCRAPKCAKSGQRRSLATECGH
jgi:hypothetical protein